jgi:exodeoxyribonuclease V gamma subunit
MPPPSDAPVPIDLELDGFRLRGALVRSRRGGFVDFRPTTAKPGDRLGLWLRHLALSAATGGGESRWLGTTETIVLRPVVAARELLVDLVSLYWDGLARPLPFFPRGSYEACVVKKKAPLDAARGQWEAAALPNVPPGDGADAYNALAFRGRDPFDDDFLALARRVVAPLLAHQTEEKS